MSPHRAVVETGPATIRRLCCGTRTPADQEVIEAALDAIDDPVALVGERPVAVEALWKTALRSACCACDGAVVVHPSWWPPARVRTVSAAAATLAGEARARPRSWLLARASRAAPEDTVVVEVAERVVAICKPAPATVTAVPRTAPPRSVADGVARAVASLAPAVVLIDLPDPIAGAAELGPLIADALRGRIRAEMVHINDIRLARLACSASD
ncbi:type VII secretion-associated protein, partial [Mycobacterium avium]|nr:type VII secretion-associated protein [Mycobacterium avium]